jgi:hypothetical protein
MLSRYDIVLVAFPFMDGAAVRAERSLLRQASWLPPRQ